MTTTRINAPTAGAAVAALLRERLDTPGPALAVKVEALAATIDTALRASQFTVTMTFTDDGATVSLPNPDQLANEDEESQPESDDTQPETLDYRLEATFTDKTPISICDDIVMVGGSVRWRAHQPAPAA